MKKSCLSVILVLLLSSFLLPQGKSSIQFAGGVVKPMSSFSGLTGTIQYNYNLNSKFNLYDYYGLFSSRGTFTEFNGGFNYRI